MQGGMVPPRHTGWGGSGVTVNLSPVTPKVAVKLGEQSEGSALDPRGDFQDHTPTATFFPKCHHRLTLSPSHSPPQLAFPPAPRNLPSTLCPDRLAYSGWPKCVDSCRVSVPVWLTAPSGTFARFVCVVAGGQASLLLAPGRADRSRQRSLGPLLLSGVRE